MDENRTAERDTFLASVLTTAVEGGINYWAHVEDYRWGLPDLDGNGPLAKSGGGWASVTIHDDEIGGGTYRLTSGDLDNVIWHMLGNRSLNLNPYVYASLGMSNVLNTTVHDQEVFDMDANVCNMVVQYALFGKIIYG